MNLSKFTIINYKSCGLLNIDIDIAQPNIFIGINDSGKSTVLKAMELFFDSKPVFLKNDKSVKSDLSNTVSLVENIDKYLETLSLPKFDFYTGKEIILIAKFGIDEEIEDSNVSEHVNWAKDNFKELWIAKVYSESNLSGNYKLLSKDCDSMELWNSAEKVLEEKMAELEISNKDTKNVNSKGKPTKIERIRAIYNKDLSKLSLNWCGFDFKKDRDIFPAFSLFNWNSDLEDLKKIVSDTTKDSIAEIEKKVYEQARVSSEEATKAVNEQLEEVTRDFIDELPGITKIEANVGFIINSQTTDILVQKDSSDGMIHIESQGDGIKRQIWFVLMKWLSNKKINPANTSKRVIWAFDEPETHLYPSAQRDFISALDKISAGSYETLIATHSTVFVDKSRLSNVKKIFLQDKYSQIAQCENVVDIYEALQLKNSDFLFYDKFLAVEGSTEYTVLPHIYALFNDISLFDSNIQLVNLKGGSNWKANKIILDQLIKNFGDTQKLLFYLLDKDTNCAENNVTLIGKMDFEDSLPNSLWIKVLFDINPANDITEADLDTLRAQIDTEQKNKFHKLIGRLMNERSPGIYLPSKGEDLGAYINKHLLKTEVPQSIIDVFDALK